MALSQTKKRALIITALCSVVYFVSYFARKDFAAVMAGMFETGIIDNATGGFINMALFICYGVGQLVSGYLGDKFKPSTIISSGLLLTTICNVLLPITKNGYLMIPIWAVNGFAQALLWPPIVKILAAELDNQSFVKANLCVTACAHVATVLLYLYTPLCLKISSWKLVFFTASILSAIILVVFTLSIWRLLSKQTFTQTKNTETSSETSIFKIMRNAGLIPIFLSIIMMGFLRDGIETWLPTLYSQVFNVDASQSILFSVILPIFAIISIVVITALHKTYTFSNEVRGAAIIFVACAILSIPVIFLIGTKNAFLQIVCLFLAALITACSHAINFLLICCLPGRFAKTGKAATASGITNACTYIGATIAMYGIPAITNLLGWKWTVGSWVLISAIGIVTLLIAYKRYTTFLRED